MNYWKITAGRAAEFFDVLKEKEVVAIGMVHTRLITGTDTIQDIRRMVREEQPTATDGRIIIQAGMLFRFYRNIQIGDRMFVYQPATRLYHIGEVISDPIFDQDQPLPHSRQVNWLQTLPRDILTITTKNALGAIAALFAITGDARAELEARLTGRQDAIPEAMEQEEDISTIGDDTFERSQEFIKDALIKLDPFQMQEMVAGLLRAMGYKTRVSPRGPDRGRDIFASPDGLGLEEPRIVVQVKHRSDTRMSAPDLHGFITVINNAKAKGIYVSTGGFSRDAQYAADASDSPLLLLDIDELASLITQYYEQCDADTRMLLPLRKMYWPIA